MHGPDIFDISTFDKDHSLGIDILVVIQINLDFYGNSCLTANIGSHIYTCFLPRFLGLGAKTLELNSKIEDSCAFEFMMSVIYRLNCTVHVEHVKTFHHQIILILRTAFNMKNRRIKCQYI